MSKLRATGGLLVIEGPAKDFTHNNWVPAGGGKIGCVLRDSKAHLGVSEEALQFLRKVKPSEDDIGDIMWWKAGKVFCFGWMGDSTALQEPGAEGAKDYAVPEGAYTIIPNDVPVDAKEYIDQTRVGQDTKGVTGAPT